MGNFSRDDRSGGRRSFGRSDFGRRSFSDRGGKREMHKAVCSECGKDCEVPFKPTGSKPVFCSECFEKKGRGADSGMMQDRGQRRPDEQFEAINRKLDKILEMLTPVKPEEKTIVPQKKTRTPKKKTPETKTI